MPDSFFERKRKRPSSAGGSGPSKSGASSSRVSAPRRKASAGSGGKPSARDGTPDSEDGEGAVDGMDLRHEYEHSVRSEDEDEQETPAEARVRLARMYVEGMRGEDIDPNDADAAAADEANIASRLAKSASSHGTHVHLRLASRLQAPAACDVLAVRGHSLSVTCAVTSSRSDSLYTASKDGSIVRWALRDGHMVSRTMPRSRAVGEEGAPAPRASTSRRSGAARRAARARGANAVPSSVIGEAEGHTDEVWSLALTDDASLLASGGPDRRVALWSLEPITASTSLAVRQEEAASSSPAPRWLSGLGGHKDAVTALAFQMGSSQLLSASNDRTLKLWDGTQRSYIETLFGHQEPALSVSVLRGDVAASAGGRDRTVRWWKIRDESQLVFRAGARSRVREVIEGGSWEKAEKDEGEQIVEGSVECVAMVDEHCFVSGGDSGALSLWSLSKKKPVHTKAAAHGFDALPSGGTATGTAPSPRGITAVACLPYSDVFASGSWDGEVRLWGLDQGLRTFSLLFSIPALGFVNSLQLVRPRLAPEPSSWRRRGGLTASADADADADSERGTSEAGGSAAEVDGEIHGAAQAAAEGKKKERSPLLIVALGQEPRLGRWMRKPEARNGALVVPLALS